MNHSEHLGIDATMLFTWYYWKIEPFRCPCCKILLDGAKSRTDVSLESPSIGDVRICNYCGEHFVFDSALKLKRARYSELTQKQRDMSADVKPIMYKKRGK